MAKSFRKFREDTSYSSDEWEDEDYDAQKKDANLQSRRVKRRNKKSERNAAMEPKDV
jgi:hypothetical protein